METNETLIKVGITQGDINGIGYEVIIKTLSDKRICDLCTPIVYGSAKLAAYHRKALNYENFSLNIIKSPEYANDKRPNIINCSHENTKIELGKSTEEAGIAAFESIQAASKDLLDGKIDVLITSPINKKNIQSEKFKFAGHTEYFQNITNSSDVLMLMIGDSMKLGVATGHIPIKDVPSHLNVDLIIAKLRLLNKCLLEDFAIRKPKIAVLGLNPHAGDLGLIGMEEEDIILPAINIAREEGILAIGPYPADGFFGSRSFLKFDAILAMYHDQGLAPFKAIEFDNGVNYSAGLPIIRTSPNHGTAYEIAGQGIASPDSFRSALYRAIEIHRNRQLYKEITKNPLNS
jgi:4-hydroxythreonine-4-phosphate dehydrogenase